MKSVMLCAILSIFFSKSAAEMPTTIATPMAAAPMPIPDPTAMAPQSSMPEQAAQAPTQEVKSEQLTFPDTFDLVENAPDLIQSDNPAIVDLFKKASNSLDEIAVIIDSVSKARADLYQKYFDLDAKLDEFFQNVSLDEGTLQGLLPIDNETSALVSNANQQDFDNIKAQLASINTAKESARNSLATLDSEIEKGKTLASTSQKSSLDILKQTDQQNAQVIYDGILQNLEMLKGLQNNTLTTTINNFQAANDKIHSIIQTVQTAITQLQAKEAAHQTNTEKSNPQTTTALKAPMPTTEHVTFPHYVLTRMSELLSGVVHIAKTTYSTVKEKFIKPTSPELAPTPRTTPQNIPQQTQTP